MSNLRQREHGVITIRDGQTGDLLAQLSTVQCVHCGGHFVKKRERAVVVPLSPTEVAAKIEAGATVRGYCTNCMGDVCGPGCVACVPQEQMLENMERGRPLDFRPVSVFTGRTSEG